MGTLDTIAAKLIFGSKLSQEDKDFAAEYLKKYYIAPNTVIVPEAMNEAVKTFKIAIGIENGPEIDEQTVRAMQYPRCGVSDVLPIVLELSQWKNKKKLTYFFQSYLFGLPQNKQEEMFFDAVNSWQTICGISFEQIRTGTPDIIINASSLRREEFGRQGGVLAWCELPQGDNRQLNLKIDDSETWTDDPEKPGIYYRAVLCHEMGHGIGIGHLQEPKQLMNPFYTPTIFDPQQYDRKEAVDRYGISVLPPPSVPEFKITVKGEIAIDGYSLQKNS